MAAYVVNEITVTDADRYKVYAELMPETLKPFGGVFLARGAPESIVGDIPSPRVVILQFPDIERARMWRVSPEYRSVLAIRDEASRSRVYVIGGENLDRFVG